MAVFKIDDINLKLLQFKDKYPNVNDLLRFCSENNCSDLYLTVNDYPYINRYGRIIRVPSEPLVLKDWNDFKESFLTSERNTSYVRSKMLDLTYTLRIQQDSKWYGIHTDYRYRVALGYSQKNETATFRVISPDLPSFNKINYPDDIKEVIKKSLSNKTGIILICGETGSGKTTTLAASINDFTKKDEPLDNSMIITLEDPIEYLYPSSNSVRIVQKELDVDFLSFADGVKQALREHPTHILCGEIRDQVGISTCIEAARTGHKVMTTFHTGSVSGTLSRLYNYLSKDGDNIMFDLIANIDLIVCQKLSSKDDKFNLETQYMYFTDKVKKHLQNVILQGKNIPMEIDELFKDKDLIENKLARDWD